MARHTPVLEMKLIKWRYAKTVPFSMKMTINRLINILGGFKRILIIFKWNKEFTKDNVLKWTQLGSITTKFDRCNC